MSFVPATKDANTKFGEDGKIKEARVIGKDVTFHFENDQITKIEIPSHDGRVLTILPVNDKYMTAENR